MIELHIVEGRIIIWSMWWILSFHVNIESSIEHMKHWRELGNLWEWTSQVAIEIKLKVKVNVLYLVNRANIDLDCWFTFDTSHKHDSSNNIRKEGIEPSVTNMHSRHLAHFRKITTKVVSSRSLALCWVILLLPTASSWCALNRNNHSMYGTLCRRDISIYVWQELWEHEHNLCCSPRL